ncbi:MAG: hypothetical protein KGL39_44715 [Patescibacteria group bacterium]|nr:hypothetical protein [Patescibacteria group bacterium]
MSAIAENTLIRSSAGWRSTTQMRLERGQFPYVLSYAPGSRCMSFEKVMDWFKHPTEPNVVVVEHHKGILVATANLEVLCGDLEFHPLEELMPGDQLIFFKDARSLERKACRDHQAALERAASEVKAMYYLVGHNTSMVGLRVENTNSYVANGLIVRGF